MEIKIVPTTCPYCGTGCGLNLVVRDGKVVSLAAWQRHPVNDGKLCPKGRYAHEFIHSEDRLKKPLIKRDGKLVETTWEEAYDHIVKKFKSYKPEEMACLASAQVTNEENYLMQKFARAALKTPNIDNGARLSQSSTIVGLEAAFGYGAMTNNIGDIAESKCVLVLGSNTLEQHPLIGRSILRAKLNGAKVIVFDPRYTTTARQADLYASLYSGTDVALLNGMMQHIIKNGWEAKEFIEKRTKGFDKLKATVMKPEYGLDNVSGITGIPAKDIATAAEWFAKSPSACLVYSLGITQHATGVDNVKSVANLLMLTGNIGKVGGGVNALCDQNNAQGACDMGALPNFYSGYLDVTLEPNITKIKDAWGCDIAVGKVGYSATEIINVLADDPSRLKALYIMGENPMVSNPDLTRVEHALKNLEFLIVQDIFLTETAQMADVVLPAACYAEKDGTQTNTERRVQRLRKAVEPPGEAKADWQIICELGKKMGQEKQFTFNSPEDIFNEIAKVTPLYGGMSYARLEKPESLHWPCPTPDHPGTPILHTEKFANTDGLGVFTSLEFKPPAEVPDAEFPLILTTGRCIWQWNDGSMTRRSPSLEKEAPAAWIEINSDDAKALGIRNSEVVHAVTRRGAVNVTAKVTSGIKRNEVFMPSHYAESAVNKLTNNVLDPVAMVPELKACAVRIEKIKEA